MPSNLSGHEDDLVRRAATVVPTPQQWRWQEMECIAFAHFGPNTFTDREWGLGTEDPRLFNPSALDCRQWVQVCREAGMKMIILTAKHHDGFCLWPSRYTAHSVKNSPFWGGKGDVVRELAEACREGGLQLGLYLSPWDRHEPTYGDSPRYNEHFMNQLRELLTGYGEITEVWFDGACAEGPNGKRQVYDWAAYYALVRELQPEALIAICGPDIRWVGNESGLAEETQWSVLGVDADLETEPFDWVAYHEALARNGAVAAGSREGLAQYRSLVWYPAECDTSIRPGWFYHASEDDKVKSLDTLLDIYYRSVGHNAILLLNLPPDRRGLIHEADVARLCEFRHTLDETFRVDLAERKQAVASNVRGHNHSYGPERALEHDHTTAWVTDEGVEQATLEVDLGAPATFDCAMLQEDIRVGQHVESYRLEAWDGAGWKELARGTTIGHKKLDRFALLTAQRVRLTVERARLFIALRTLGLYRRPSA